MLSNDERRYLDQLGDEQDRLFIEHERWEASREAAGSLPMQKSDAEAVIDRTDDENATAAAPQPAPAPDKPWLFGDERDEILTRAIGYALGDVRHECRTRLDVLEKEIVALKKNMRVLRREFEADLTNGVEVYCHSLERKIALLENENIEIKGVLGSALRRLGQADDANIIDLPDWRTRKRTDAA